MVITIALPNCKSILIRQLIHRFVSDGAVLLVSENESSDVIVTHAALNAIVKNQQENSDFQIKSVNVADCGAAYRFLMALLSVTPGKWFLTGTERLLNRPIQDLVDTLHGIGANIVPVQNGWQIEGQTLEAESLIVNCSKSSQYASALLLIAPKLGLKELQLQPSNIPSEPYAQLTRACMDYEVQMPELGSKPSCLGRLGDWSAAAFWYAYAVLHPEQEFLLGNLSLNSAQGDAFVAQCFIQLGVESKETEDGVMIVARKKRFPEMIKLDMADHLDLVPVMVALACQLPIHFVFENIRNLIYKESDRMTALQQLSPLAEKMVAKDDVIEVVGKEMSYHQELYLDTCADHRLAMAFLLLGKNVKLNDTNCLRKSYPALLEQLKKINLQIEK